MVTKSGGSGGGFLMPRNKKGQEMSTNTIILIVLGVIVLVILVLGFRLGWNKVLPFLPSNNIQNIVGSCDAACATTSEYDYCNAERILKADDLTYANGTEVKQLPGSCYNFSTQSHFTKYGVSNCQAIDCK